MTYRTLLLGVLCTLFTVSVFAQKSNDLPGASVVRFYENNDLPKFIRFAENIDLTAAEAQMYLQKHLGFSDRTSFTVLSVKTDKLGSRHTRIQQQLDGKNVMGGVYFLHERNGRVESMNGKLFNITQTATATLSPDEAVAVALQHLPAETYGWEVPAVQHDGHTHTRSAYPQPELVWVATQLDYRLPEFRQAYLTDIFAVTPLSRKRIYVDAQTGMVIAEENRLCSFFDEDGTAETQYSGTQNITTDNDGGTYRLRETGRNITTLQAETGADFTNSTNNWTPAADDINAYAVDVHVNTEQYYDLMLEEYGRNSVDNQGMNLLNSVHTDGNLNNAYWTGDGALFGNGDGIDFNHFSTPEITGHEYHHGTTEFTAGLFYVNESGGVNEFMSDVFGHLTYIRARGAENTDWLVGEQVTIDGSGVRNMANPSDFNYADTYGGSQYAYTNSVHRSSSIGNFWFYLLSDGATGVNDFGTAYEVPGIGTDKAGQIALRTLVYYLTPTSDYLDVSFFSKQAAIDLYGGCSGEVAAVVEAWRAVALDVSDDAGFVADFQANNLQCENPATVNFQNLSSATASVTWDFGDGNTSTEHSPQHTYTTGGIYTVTMTAEGCNDETSTVTKQNYVNIDPNASFCNAMNMPTSGTLTLTDCSGRIFDSGGPDGDYGNNINSVLIIDPASDAPVTLDFLFFLTEFEYDLMRIYDGVGTSAPLIDIYNYTDLFGETITSTGGAITVQFTSDGSVGFPGFEIFYTTDGGEVPTVADFTVSDSTPPLNAPVVFTSQAEGTGVVLYDFGDGETATGENVVHYFANPGTYTVTQTAENCLGFDQKTETVTVDAAGDFAVKPESLTVTLSLGETSDETVTITNTAAGELYHAFTPAPSTQEFFSETIYTEAGATTQHTFTDLHPLTDNLELKITLNGDFSIFTQNATLTINGTDYGVIDDGDTGEGTDVEVIYNISDDDEVRDLIADGTIEFIIQNSEEVELPGLAGNFHRVELTTAVNDFLTIDQPEAYTAGNSTTALNFNFDTDGLLGGTYSYDMPLRTGDPDQIDLVYPITLIAVGQAEIAATPAAVDFGEGFIDVTTFADLLLENAGTDTLRVTNITSDNAVFGTTETVFNIAPQSEYTAQVAFTPDASGSFTGNFTVESNVADLIVPATGTAASVPVAVFSANNLTVDLVMNETTTEAFNLGNTGEAQLNWEILSENTNYTTNVVLWTYGGRQDPELDNMTEFLEALPSNYNVSYNDANTYAGLQASMTDADIIIVPTVRDGYLSLYSDLAPAVREFVRKGGSVIALAESINRFVGDTGIMNYSETQPTYGQLMTVEQPAHPLAQGLPATFQNPLGTNALVFTSEEVEVIVTAAAGGAQLAYRDFGLGKMIYYGNTYFDFAAEDLTMFTNALEYASAGKLPKWLIPAATAGNVGGGENTDVEFLFNATGLYAGMYTYDVQLEINEPGNNFPTINATLNVTAAPEIDFSANTEFSCDGIIDFTDDSANEPTAWL